MEYFEIELIIEVVRAIYHKKNDMSSLGKLSYKAALELVKKVSDRFIVQQVRIKEFFYMFNRVVLENNCGSIFKSVRLLDGVAMIDIQEVIDFMESMLQGIGNGPLEV